jgi:hypothetical protein
MEYVINLCFYTSLSMIFSLILLTSVSHTQGIYFYLLSKPGDLFFMRLISILFIIPFYCVVILILFKVHFTLKGILIIVPLIIGITWLSISLARIGNVIYTGRALLFIKRSPRLNRFFEIFLLDTEAIDRRLIDLVIMEWIDGIIKTKADITIKQEDLKRIMMDRLCYITNGNLKIIKKLEVSLDRLLASLSYNSESPIEIPFFIIYKEKEI